MDSGLCEVKLRMHQESALSQFTFEIVVDVVTELASEDVLSELYADDLVQMSETIQGLRNIFTEWKEPFESKGLKVNVGKAK